MILIMLCKLGLNFFVADGRGGVGWVGWVGTGTCHEKCKKLCITLIQYNSKTLIELMP